MSIHPLNNGNLPHDDITLARPQGIQGGAYLSKIKFNDDLLLLQLNKCFTKNGIIKTDKKMYCDLMFDIDDEKTSDFFLSIEDAIKNLIFEKRNLWFHSEMDMDTIDYHWQPILRPYQNNKYLLRAFIKKPKSSISNAGLYIYDENENPLTLDDVTKDKQVITIIKIASLKFTQQSFNIEIFLDQVMVLDEKESVQRCLIKKDTTSHKAIPSHNSLEKETLEKESLEQKILTPEKINNESSKSKTIEEESLEKTNNLDELENNDDNLENIDLDDIEILDTLNLDDDNTTNTDNDKDNNTNDVGNKDNKKDNNKETEDIDKNSDLADEENKVKLNVSPKDENNDNIIETNSLKKDISLAINDEKDKLAATFNIGNLDEVELDITNDNFSEPVSLKPPNEVYNAIYKEVRKKAKDAKKKALEAYLEVKRIKSLYGLQDIESSDEENTNDIF